MHHLLVLSVQLLICSSLLDLLTPNILKKVRDCMAKKSLSNQINCDNHINNFLIASNSAISEIYSTIKPINAQNSQTQSILGVQSGVLRLSSSSTLYYYCQATRARLNYAFGDGFGCWWANRSATDEFIQASSSIPVLIQTIQTIGCPNSSGRLTKLKLLYTLDGENWIAYNNGEEFSGNFDRNTVNRIVVSPFVAKSVRIYPLNWTSGVSTRLEVEISKIYYDPLPPKKPDQVWIAAIKSGFNTLASSIYSPDYGTSNSMLNFRSLRTSNAWCAGFNNTSQWFSVSSPNPVTWKQISIQGSSENKITGIITQFSISYTLDGIVWDDYKNKQTFHGSYDFTTPVALIFSPSFSAISIKVLVTGYSGGLCMRIEVFCSKISS